MVGSAPDGDGHLDPEEPLSQEEIDNYTRRLDELDRDFKELDARNKPRLDSWLKKLAGPTLDSLLQSQEATLSCLTSPNANLRRAAVHLAVDHWRLRDSIARQCENMALTDPDSGVRETAIGALGSCYSRTKDARIGKSLAALARDTAETKSIRIRAYSSLVRLHGYADCIGISVFAIRSPADFDPNFLDQYHRE